MKQVLQDLRNGELLLADVGAPAVRPGHLLIRSTRSLISSGTERSLVEFGRAGYVAKARKQPERVKEVLDKVRTDGVVPTIDAVRSKLDQPIPMGYCNVGRVIAVGSGVDGFRLGDRVASNGHHAEIVLVPKHLAAKIPDTVADDDATFTVLGAIALQGIRLLEPSLGESMAVFGLGLIGLVAAQLLQADGAKVIGFDASPERVELARRQGVTAVDLSSGVSPVDIALDFTDEQGIDGVLITASTPSNEVVHEAALMSRQRGRIILTGVVGLDLRRSDFYEKELRFQVSCSYGPGRYDPAYEDRGQDYPLGFVRWTAQRNFTAVLDLMAAGRLRVRPLISTRVPFEKASQAYTHIDDPGVIGVLLDYPDNVDDAVPPRTVSHRPVHRVLAGKVVCGVIGAGAFSQAKILPALGQTDVRLKWISSTRGLSGAVAARKFDIELSTTDSEAVLADPEVNLVVVATRHDSHARYVVKALQAGKSVFVEKPLCIRPDELAELEHAYQASQADGSAPLVMVGFNRRFSPLVNLLFQRLSKSRQPVAMTYTCNAGHIPGTHWVHDPVVGGGRLVGEACHFVDLLHHLAGAKIASVSAVSLGDPASRVSADTFSITLKFENGSIGDVHYFANGSKRYPKERLEVFSDGRVMVLDNYRQLRIYGMGPRFVKRMLKQDKGHGAELRALVRAVADGEMSPISFESSVHVMQATFAAVQSLQENRAIELV